MEGAITQLHSLSLRNGYSRTPSHTIPRQSNKQNWTAIQQQMQWQMQQHPAAYPVQMIAGGEALHINLQHKSTAGSESGSSTGDISPPPPSSSGGTDPSSSIGMHGNSNQTQSSASLRQNKHLSRLNGGGGTSGNVAVTSQQIHQTNNSNNNSNNLDFNGTPTTVTAPGATIMSSNSSGNLSILRYIPMPGTPPTIVRQQIQPPPFQTQNGELIYPFPAGFLPPAPNPVTMNAAVVASQRASPSAASTVPSTQTPPITLPTPYPTSKMVTSCFNCGSMNHTGLNCSEASMEDVTRNAGYKLDFSIITQPSSQFTSTQLTSSASSGNLVNQQHQHQPNINNQNPPATTNNNSNQFESEPAIPVIDLTQDTSSSSSSASSTSSIHGK